MFMFDETSSQGGSFHPLFQIFGPPRKNSHGSIIFALFVSTFHCAKFTMFTTV